MYVSQICRFEKDGDKIDNWKSENSQNRVASDISDCQVQNMFVRIQ